MHDETLNFAIITTNPMRYEKEYQNHHGIKYTTGISPGTFFTSYLSKECRKK
jgi:hypothetical protein